MSGSSFPRTDHMEALRQKIVERLHAFGSPSEIVDRSPNHFKCHYRFGLRVSPFPEWFDLSVHFQYVERMFASGDDTELNRIIDEFLRVKFSPPAKPV